VDAIVPKEIKFIITVGKEPGYMNKAFVLFSFLLISMFTYCTNPVVGSKKATVYKNVTFHVDTIYLSSSSLVAKGTVSNIGKDTIPSPWTIEGQFYTDTTRLIKLGGDNTEIKVPLEPNRTTFWQIMYSSSVVDLKKYPHAIIDDLRALYN